MGAEEKKILKSLLPGAVFVAFIWFIHFLAWVTDTNIAFLGVYPRHLSGIPGIFLSPLIHGDLLHLLSNTFPLLLLSGFLFYHYPRLAVEICIWLYLTTNLWTFMLARQSYHIGASGVVYGLASYLLFSGLFRRDRDAITLSAVVLVLYGGMVYGVLPLEEGISWESHLFGAISGLLLAWHFRKHYRPVKPKTTTFHHENLEALSDPFAPWNLTQPEVWLDLQTWRQAQLEREQLLQQQYPQAQINEPEQEAATPKNNGASAQNTTVPGFYYHYYYVPRNNQNQLPKQNNKPATDAEKQ